ncbi:SRPBCC family protein [Dactylosporangium cerinum]|uniref:SRPBCC family protein n=1 Tax=Dactylosporangium cerinum TaxID=1434730 RepID=A0ABV9W5L4_9ACTN
MTLRREISVEGPRDVDEVWDRYVRPGRWPEWSPQIRAVDYPLEVLRPATSGVVHGPAGLRVRFQVVDVDGRNALRTWSWIVSVAGVRLALRHTVQATAAGTRTGLTVEGFAPVVASYLPVARVALRRLVR